MCVCVFLNIILLSTTQLSRKRKDERRKKAKDELDARLKAEIQEIKNKTKEKVQSKFSN